MQQIQGFSVLTSLSSLLIFPAPWGGMVGPEFMSRAKSGGFLYRLSRNAEHGVCLSGTANPMLGCVVRG